MRENGCTVASTPHDDCFVVNVTTLFYSFIDAMREKRGKESIALFSGAICRTRHSASRALHYYYYYYTYNAYAIIVQFN